MISLYLSPRQRNLPIIDGDDLLPRRMAALHLDVDGFARREPLTFRELHRLCALCDSHRQCARGLADEMADPGWQDWRDYCPNATTLSLLSALEGCGAGA